MAAISSGSDSTHKPGTSRPDTGLLVCCPVTTKMKSYPFEGPLSGSPPSDVLADQVESLGEGAGRFTKAP